MVSPLVHINDEQRRSDAIVGKNLLYLAMPWVSHLAKEDEGCDRVDVLDEEIEVVSSIGMAGVKVEHDSGVEGDGGVNVVEGVGGSRGDKLALAGYMVDSPRSALRALLRGLQM